MHISSKHVLTQNNLRCAVVPGGDDCTVVFVVKSSAAEIDHPHGRALHHTLVSLLRKRDATVLKMCKQNLKITQGQQKAGVMVE